VSPAGSAGANDLGRSAEKRQDVRLLTERRRHLVHRSAWRARRLLRAVSEQRQAARLELVAERTGRRLRNGDLDRSRGTETLALRHRRGKEEPQPGDGEPLLSGQQRDGPQHVVGAQDVLGAGVQLRVVDARIVDTAGIATRRRPLTAMTRPSAATCAAARTACSIGKPRTSPPA
jgi:hypothetical protein